MRSLRARSVQLTASVALNLSHVSSSYANDVLVPTGITVLANSTDVTGNAVFVSAYDQSVYNPGGTTNCTSPCANPGWVFGFVIGSGGTLTASTSGNPAITVSPWQAGVKPTAIASDPTDRFVYVTDFAQDQLIGYTIIDGSVLNFLTNGPFKTGNRALRRDYRSARHVHLCDQFVGFHGVSLRDHAGDRSSFLR